MKGKNTSKNIVIAQKSDVPKKGTPDFDFDFLLYINNNFAVFADSLEML